MGVVDCIADRISVLDAVASTQVGSTHLKERWLRRVSAPWERCGGSLKKGRHTALRPRLSPTKLLSRDLQVGDDVRVPTLNAAGVDCRRCVTVSTSVRHCRIRVEGTSIQYPVDLREATARCRVPSTVNVIAGDV